MGLLNVDGYYDTLLALFDKGVSEGFIKPACRDIIVSAPIAEELLTRMEVSSDINIYSFQYVQMLRSVDTKSTVVS